MARPALVMRLSFICIFVPVKRVSMWLLSI